MKHKIKAHGALLIRTASMAAAAALCLSSSLAMAADTLQDALVAAYNTNPKLLAQRAQLRATDENVAKAVSGWRPTIVARGSFGSQTTRRASGLGRLFGNKNSTTPKTGSLELTQPVFSGLRTLNSTREAKAQVRSGRATLLSTEQQVLLDAATAYIDVVQDQAVLELRQNNVKVLERQLEAARDRFEVGEITRTDVAQAEARLSGARSELSTAEATLTGSREAFQRVIGQMPGTLSVPEKLPVIPDTEGAAASIAQERNPALRSAIENEKASHYAVKVAVGSLLPTIDFQADANHAEDQSITGDQTTSYSFFGHLTVPIYQAGAEYANIRQAKELNNVDRMQIVEVRREVVENVAKAWEALRAARDVIKSSREQVRANEIAFEGVQQEAQVGSRTTLDVLNADLELLNSRVVLVRARRDEFVATYSLLAAIGRLTAMDLGLPVDYYDPTKNYDRVKWKPFGW